MKVAIRNIELKNMQMIKLNNTISKLQAEQEKDK